MLQTLELHRSADHAELVKLRETTQRLHHELQELTKMGMVLRRDIFSKFGTFADQMSIIEDKFAVMEL